jgi:hypothetical protein
VTASSESPPNTRMQRTRSSPSALRSPLMRCPLGRLKLLLVLGAILLVAPLAADGDGGMMVYGSDWGLLISEPAGWHGDTEEVAKKYRVSVVFLPQAAESRKADVTIRVRVGKKTDDNIAGDLTADMDGYKKEYPKVEFSELSDIDSRYPVVAKMFFVRGEFYEYVAYLNPGKEYPHILSVALSKAKEAATPSEMAAYQKVIQSLIFTRRKAA